MADPERCLDDLLRMTISSVPETHAMLMGISLALAEIRSALH